MKVLTDWLANDDLADLLLYAPILSAAVSDDRKLTLVLDIGDEDDNEPQ